MVLNFSTTEYHILCKVADFHGTMPAQWCHDQIMHKAYSEWKVIKEWESERGKMEGDQGMGK